MRTGWGTYLPNEGDVHLSEALEVAGNGCYTLLHHVAGRDDCLRTIRRRFPEALILVRAYTPNWYAWDPHGWAAEVHRILHGGPDPLSRYTRHLTWANEQNLALESGGLVGASDSRQITWRDYVVIAAWNEEFVTAYRALPGSDLDVLHYPAMAFGHGEDWGYDRSHSPLPGFPLDSNGTPVPGYEALRRGIELCPVLNVHPYRPHPPTPVLDPWEGVGRIERTANLFPGRPLFADETGQFDVTAPSAPEEIKQIGYYFQGLDYVLGWTPFILASADPGHDANNWSRNPGIAAAYKRTVRLPKPDVGPVPPTPTPPEAPAVMHVIDVSNHQGTIDWDRVAAHRYSDGSRIEAAIIKFSEDDYGAVDFYDSFAARNWLESKRVGLARKCYHYAQPSKSSPAESVTVLETALKRVGGLGPRDGVCLDIEEGQGSLHVWVAEWIGLCRQVFGMRPVMYSGLWFMEPHDLLHEDLAPNPLWYASYQATLPPAPAPWDTIDIWQYSASGAVSGIYGPVDMNYFYGTRDSFELLGNEPETPVPPPVDPWETAVFAPINAGAQAVFTFATATPDDLDDATSIIRAMDRMKARHP